MTKTSFRTAGVLFYALIVLGATAGAEIIEQILVKVNGELFSKTELEARQVAVLQERGQLDPTTLLGDAQLREMLDEMTPEIIVVVIDEMLLVQRGKELGYQLSDAQFVGILEDIKKENKIENDEQLQAALKQENITMDDLRRSVERRMMMTRVEQNEILGRIAVSEDDARRYFDAHVGEFTTPQAVTLREILVAVPTDGKTLNVGQDEAARHKANQIRQRALAGESVEKLASELSDAPSRANAGLVGPLNIGELSPDLRELVEAMKVGQISEVVRTTRGHLLLKLESSTPPETLPFEGARDQIRDRVFSDKREAEYEKFLSRLRADAIIEWENDEIEKAYDRGLERIKEQTNSTAPSAR